MTVYKKHPIFSALGATVFLALLYVLLPREDLISNAMTIERMPPTVSLADRLERANRVYDRALEGRQALIEHFGPTPQHIMMFPPNVAPWPAYTIWSFFPAAYNCPHEVQRIGALGDGGKWVCGLSQLKTKRDCVIYSFGINHESSFEAGVLESSNHCEIWGYDFTVNSFGPEISSDLSSRVHFHPYALGGRDGIGPMDSKMYTLETLMKQNQHTHIDILKIDIEGWEFETLETLVKPYIESGKPLPFGQLQIELHVWKKQFTSLLKWWTMLEEAGLRPFWTEPNMVYKNYNKDAPPHLSEYSFLNIKGDNAFITE